jgi:glyoxylase-like metal-dependent hydrolase (beta-lactamase superfamily II)
MRHALSTLAVSTLLATAASTCALAQGAPAPAAADVALARIECGTPVENDVAVRFSDTFAYNGLKVMFSYSCYLIRHGSEYMLWDTGHSMSAGAPAPKVSIVDQLATANVTPAQIRYVGISHFHADHTGQLPSFPGATLLIGKGDWDGATAATPIPGANAGAFRHWASGAGKVEPLTGDKDVFGDGSVLIMNTPGHTPGHHSLLVRLKEKGPVLISGDLAHFHENYESNGVPSFNFHRGDTLASLDRFKKAAANLKATVILQHDLRDVGKLPALPAMAK